MSAKRTPLLCELCILLPPRPLAGRRICDMPVRWSHLSTADCHLVRFSVATSFWICLFRSLSASSEGFSRRYRSRSKACDLADTDRV